ncbi:SEC14-like protein 2 like protein [Argiope bruennichi]|uniref:SEC14-like protein 2 like protein n=1 Tax=Argiope bruennichi TaxID=94029 RepID=A0A8T0ELS7_ARGBR|nr:SEC14-like protein 2 like protein [Argiope bruennichi]
MSGHLGDLSPSQEQALEELREIFKDELLPQQDDHLLLQFLRAKKFDLKKTEEMFSRHLEFRKEFPEEYYAKEYQLPKNIAILRDFLMPPVLGYDKDGCPVRLVQVGYQDIKGALCCVRPSELPKYIVWFLDTDKEEMRKRSRETGIHIDKRTFIIDLDGLNLMHIYRRDVYEMALASLKLYENNYPENLKVAFIINRGWKETSQSYHSDPLLGYGGSRAILMETQLAHTGENIKSYPNGIIPKEHEYFE